jgi:hypothetical protein
MVRIRLSISISTTLDWYSPKSRELLDGSRSTAAIMASSLAGVRAVRERPAFTSAVNLTIHVSRRRCYICQNILDSGGRRPGCISVLNYYWQGGLKACSSNRRRCIP